ncbi:MAG: AMP-binding protein, partial [Deltaproteobacteria bacterium]|nr:AMP-binding protein [Deltaproteobacteria bacterium]
YEPLLRTVQALAAFEAAEEDDAIVVYTGGTTGQPKGVRLSHRNIVMNALQVGWETRPRADDIFLHVAPMFHSAEFISNPFFLSGAAHVYLPRFSGSAVLEAIDRFKVTCTLLTPTMIINILQAEDFHRYDMSSLRQIFYGSAPMAAEWIRRAMEGLRGVEFLQGYGLTETAPILTILGMREHELGCSSPGNQLLGSAGRQVAGVELKIVNQEGVEVPTNESAVRWWCAGPMWPGVTSIGRKPRTKPFEAVGFSLAMSVGWTRRGISIFWI